MPYQRPGVQLRALQSRFHLTFEMTDALAKRKASSDDASVGDPSAATPCSAARWHLPWVNRRTLISQCVKNIQAVFSSHAVRGDVRGHRELLPTRSSSRPSKPLPVCSTRFHETVTAAVGDRRCPTRHASSPSPMGLAACPDEHHPASHLDSSVLGTCEPVAQGSRLAIPRRRRNA